MKEKWVVALIGLVAIMQMVVLLWMAEMSVRQDEIEGMLARELCYNAERF